MTTFRARENSTLKKYMVPSQNDEFKAEEPLKAIHISNEPVLDERKYLVPKIQELFLVSLSPNR